MIARADEQGIHEDFRSKPGLAHHGAQLLTATKATKTCDWKRHGSILAEHTSCFARTTQEPRARGCEVDHRQTACPVNWTDEDISANPHARHQEDEGRAETRVLR
jgi:hypothetical protein